MFAHKTIGQVANHFAVIIAKLETKPVLIGHSVGGLLAQIIAGRGLAAATVAIDPAPFRGVLPLPISALKSARPVLDNPANRNRAVPLTYDQFRYAFANAVSEDEAKELYERFAVPASATTLFQAAAANLNPWTEARVDTETPQRGPLLIISGDENHAVPWAIANAAYRRQKHNDGRPTRTSSSPAPTRPRSPMTRTQKLCSPTYANAGGDYPRRRARGFMLPVFPSVRSTKMTRW